MLKCAIFLALVASPAFAQESRLVCLNVDKLELTVEMQENCAIASNRMDWFLETYYPQMTMDASGILKDETLGMVFKGTMTDDQGEEGLISIEIVSFNGVICQLALASGFKHAVTTFPDDPQGNRRRYQLPCE